MNYKDSITQSKAEGIPLVIRHLFTDLPDWDSALDQLNYSIKLIDDTQGNVGAKEIVGAVNFWSKLTLTVEKLNKKYISQLDNFENTLVNMCSGYCGNFGIISFTDSEPTTGKHNDPVDVIYVQCIGEVVWNTYPEGVHSKHHLFPGDAIFVPSKIDHEIESLGPRMAVSFMFNGDSNE